MVWKPKKVKKTSVSSNERTSETNDSKLMKLKKQDSTDKQVGFRLLEQVEYLKSFKEEIIKELNDYFTNNP